MVDDIWNLEKFRRKFVQAFNPCLWYILLCTQMHAVATRPVYVQKMQEIKRQRMLPRAIRAAFCSEQEIYMWKRKYISIREIVTLPGRSIIPVSDGYLGKRAPSRYPPYTVPLPYPPNFVPVSPRPLWSRDVDTNLSVSTQTLFALRC
ncbi:hypothetical protein CC80DRAFT_296285 [Byssothecium circinans]|uniref:Uncharacterized protein n=1 Tax=Byssothecium circinans TaxID=147558 RepID=A0A6A5T7D8_9PLEO|nr:hypothetical protein CC80DRAFT_296285 [Byssothecium circinans]